VYDTRRSGQIGFDVERKGSLRAGSLHLTEQHATANDNDRAQAAA